MAERDPDPVFLDHFLLNCDGAGIDADAVIWRTGNSFQTYRTLIEAIKRKSPHSNALYILLLAQKEVQQIYAEYQSARTKNPDNHSGYL